LTINVYGLGLYVPGPRSRSTTVYIDRFTCIDDRDSGIRLYVHNYDHEEDNDRSIQFKLAASVRHEIREEP
jgi:hypothetical protein